MKLPRKINFDVSSYCNHACTFCPNSDKRSLKNKVTLEKFITVMDNITKELEIDEIGLSARGEVILNKELSEIIKACKERYKIPYVYISSNGALASKEVLTQLLESGLDSIKFSINAFDEKDYANVHQANDFNKVINNLNTLLNLKKDKFHNTRVFISCVVNDSKEDVQNIFKKLCKDTYEYLNDIFIYQLGYTQRDGEIKSDKKIKKACTIPFNELYINSDCDLVLCCVDYFGEFNFGSLLNENVSKLYNSKKFQDIRDMHDSLEFSENHLCKNCLLFKEV